MKRPRAGSKAPAPATEQPSPVEPPTLFVVGTPIGNLGDLTARAIRVLEKVAGVAAEDTRRTRELLSHLGLVGKRLLRLDAHAPVGNFERVSAMLEAGQSVALVTDAGMPSISDPGAELVRRIRQEGGTVTVVPGPSALTAAVALSGLVEGPFWFLGFLPRKGLRRKELLERIRITPEPIVLFESPARTQQTLEDLASLAPQRVACVCRELTKLHEESRCGPVRELAAVPAWRGEVTIVLAAGDVEPAKQVQDPADLDRQILERLAAGASVRDIARDLGGQTGLGRREIYQRASALRDRPAGPTGRASSSDELC